MGWCLVKRGNSPVNNTSTRTIASWMAITAAKACAMPCGSQRQIERAERRDAERQPGLLQGDQHAAADAGVVRGNVGEHDAEQAGEQHRLSRADQRQRQGEVEHAGVRPGGDDHGDHQRQPGAWTTPPAAIAPRP